MPAVRQTVKSHPCEQNRTMIPLVRSGSWSVGRIEAFLHDAVIPMRLASNGTFPIVQSLWFVYEDGRLLCATQKGSVVARRLGRDGRCGFEVSGDSPPYRGVRGTGLARLDDGSAAEVLTRLIRRYQGAAPTPLGDWLLSRVDTEVAITIEDLAVTSWDYSGRM